MRSQRFVYQFLVRVEFSDIADVHIFRVDRVNVERAEGQVLEFQELTVLVVLAFLADQLVLDADAVAALDVTPGSSVVIMPSSSTAPPRCQWKRFGPSWTLSR